MKKLVLGWMIIILMIFSVFSLLLFFGHGGITGAVTVDGNNGFVVSAEVSSCGTVSSDITFSEDVNAAGDCFNIVADNVVINGAGYSLYGNGSGIAFIFGDYENLTISNFT